MLVQAGLFSRVQNLSSSTSSIHVIGQKNPDDLSWRTTRVSDQIQSGFTWDDWGLKWRSLSLSLTLAKDSSVSVLTPKRGMLELVRLVLCMSFFTPLIWHMVFLFNSFSFCICGDGISTSCCLSGGERERERPKTHDYTDIDVFMIDGLPKNVLEMYSETWLPDLLISDRCVNSLFNIRLNYTDKTRRKTVLIISHSNALWLGDM